MKSLHKSKGPGIHGVPKSTKIKELAVILDEQWENMGQTDKWKYEEMQEKAQNFFDTYYTDLQVQKKVKKMSAQKLYQMEANITNEELPRSKQIKTAQINKNWKALSEGQQSEVGERLKDFYYMKEVFEKLPDAKKSKTPPKKKSISSSVETKKGSEVEKDDQNNEDHLVDGFDLGSVQEVVFPLPTTRKEENLEDKKFKSVSVKKVSK